VCRKKAPGAVIILTAITPRNDTPAVMATVNKVNARLARLADGKRVRYLNVNDKLADGQGKLLEGMSPDRLHLSAKGYQVWADRWDRDLADVFAVQDEIAHAIASTFKLRLTHTDGSGGGGRTQNVEAYDRYLKGRYLLSGRHAEEAIAEFEAAVERVVSEMGGIDIMVNAAGISPYRSFFDADEPRGIRRRAAGARV